MVNMTNYEEYMLLYADRELSKEDEQALLAFVEQHPELKAELKAYAATMLQPDTTVVFEGKETLMKDEPRKGAIWLSGWKTYAAAASVILFITLFAISRKGDNQTELPVTIHETMSTHTIADATPAITTHEATTVEEDTLPVKEVHSTKPVDAVALETKQKPPVQERVKQQPAIQQPLPTPEEKVAVEQIKPVVRTENKQPEPVIVKTKPEVNNNIIQEEPEEVILPGTEHRKKNRFFASIINRKPLIINELETAVTEKFALARNATQELKNTELNVRIGNKDLLTVRL